MGIDRIKNNGMWKEKINARTCASCFSDVRRMPQYSFARIAIPLPQKSNPIGLFPFLPRLSLVRVLFKFMSPLSTPGGYRHASFIGRALASLALCYAPSTPESGTDTFSQFRSAVNCLMVIHENGSAPMHPHVLFLHSSKFCLPTRIHLSLQFQECHKIGDFQFLRYVYGCNDRETCSPAPQHLRLAIPHNGTAIQRHPWPAYSR